MLHPANFQFMIGTERTEVRKIDRDTFIELRYRVTGVKYKAATRHAGPAVIVYGECVGHERIEGHPNATWFGAYCSESFRENPEQMEAPEVQEEIPVIVVGQVEQAIVEIGYTDPGYAVFERDGRVHVSYTLGSWADGLDADTRRETVELKLIQLEKALSNRGYTVIMFVPDTGIRFYRLTVTGVKPRVPGALVDPHTWLRRSYR